MREYQYHQAVPGTSHEAYLDTPQEVIEAMIRIHSAAKDAEAKRQKGEASSSGGGAGTPRLG